MSNIKLIPILLLFFACKSNLHLRNAEVIQSRAKKIISIGYFQNVNDTAEIVEKKRDSAAKYIEHFNKNGKIIYSTSSGLGYYFTDYKYSKNGNLIEKTLYNKDSTVNYRKTFHYEKNRMLQKTDYSRKELSTELLFEYNKKTKSTIISKVKNGSYKIVTKIFYDKRGREIKKNRYHSSGQLGSVTNIFYDKKNNIKKKSLENITKNVIYLNTYDYDGLGNKILKKSYKVKGTDTTLRFTEKYVNVYDKKNRLIKSTMSSTENKTAQINEWSYY